MLDGKRKRCQYEIDFVVNIGSEKVYIQSALNVNTPEKKKQETFSLHNTDDFFRKIVVLDGSQKMWVDDDGVILALKSCIISDANMKSFGLKRTSRIKTFVFKYVSVPAKWVKTARFHLLRLYHKDSLRKRVVLERYPQPQISKILQVADFRIPISILLC